MLQTHFCQGLDRTLLSPAWEPGHRPSNSQGALSATTLLPPSLTTFLPTDCIWKPWTLLTC